MNFIYLFVYLAVIDLFFTDFMIYLLIFLYPRRLYLFYFVLFLFLLFLLFNFFAVCHSLYNSYFTSLSDFVSLWFYFLNLSDGFTLSILLLKIKEKDSTYLFEFITYLEQNLILSFLYLSLSLAKFILLSSFSLNLFLYSFSIPR